MKILIVSPNSSFGGSSTANLNIAKMLHMAGYEVVYNDEFLVHKPDVPFEISNFNLYGERKENNSLVHFVFKGRYDYVLLGDNRLAIPFFIQLLYLRRKGIKIGLIFHSFNIGTKLKSRITDLLVSLSTLSANNLIYVSKFTLTSWTRRYLIPRLSKKKNVVIYNAVNKALPSASINGKPKIIFVGRFSSEKRPDLFCKLAEQMWEKYDFVMWGDGPMFEKLSQQYSSFVQFKGYCNNIDKIYHNSSLLVVPSLYENCPMCVLEAMVRGIPCVCTRVGSIPDIVREGQNGEFLDESSLIQSFSEITRKIFNNYNDYVQNCISRSKEYILESRSLLWKNFLNGVKQ